MPRSHVSLLRTAHRWTGMTCAGVFALMLMSGAALMFQRELHLTGAADLIGHPGDLRALDRAIVDAASTPRVPVFLSPPPDSMHAWQLITVPSSGDSELAEVSSIDPETGAILSKIKVREAAASVLLKLHTELFAGRWGHRVVLLVSIAMMLLAVSGFTLARRRWMTIRSFPWKTTSSWIGVHRWAGLVGVLLILMWSTTGFLMLGRIVIRELSQASPLVSLKPLPLGISVGTVVHHPAVESQGELWGIGLPTTSSPYIEVTILRRAAAPWRKYVQLRLNPLTGAVLERRGPEGQSRSADLFAIADSIHKSQSDPIALHRAYLLAVSIPLLIVISGPMSWLSRRRRVRIRPV